MKEWLKKRIGIVREAAVNEVPRYARAIYQNNIRVYRDMVDWLRAPAGYIRLLTVFIYITAENKKFK